MIGHSYQQKVQTESVGHIESAEAGGVLHSGVVNINTPRPDNALLSVRQIESATLIKSQRQTYGIQSAGWAEDAAAVWGHLRKPLLDAESHGRISACNLIEMEYAAVQAAMHLAKETITPIHEIQPREVEEIRARLMAFLHTHVVFPKYFTTEPATKTLMGHLARAGQGCQCQLRDKAWLLRTGGKACIHGRRQFCRKPRLPIAWTQSRIKQLCGAFLQHLCTWPSFGSHQKFERGTEQGLALFFDCVLRCGGQLLAKNP
jgi:hypothetical protein